MNLSLILDMLVRMEMELETIGVWVSSKDVRIEKSQWIYSHVKQRIVIVLKWSWSLVIMNRDSSTHTVSQEELDLEWDRSS